PGDAAGANDVDGGKTSLLTNLFDASAGSDPIVDYYRWYSNDLGGDPGNDYWRTYISNDAGSTWVPVENTKASNESWQRVLFSIKDYVTPTSTMRMKFVAQDSASGSLVEGAVDDFKLLSYFPDAVSNPGVTPAVVALAPATPNPMVSRTRLAFTLPVRQQVMLRVFDLSGRAVRTLADA